MTEPEHSAPSLAAAVASAIPRLRRYATALVGNAADADDLVQDCVERALSRLETLASLIA